MVKHCYITGYNHSDSSSEQMNVSGKFFGKSFNWEIDATTQKPQMYT